MRVLRFGVYASQATAASGRFWKSIRVPVGRTGPDMNKAAEPKLSGLAAARSQASVLATPIGQVMPLGPWLQ